MAWLSVSWLGLFCLGLAWLGLFRLGLFCLGLVWLGLFCLGLVWLGLAWFGVAWRSLAWGSLAYRILFYRSKLRPSRQSSVRLWKLWQQVVATYCQSSQRRTDDRGPFQWSQVTAGHEIESEARM